MRIRCDNCSWHGAKRDLVISHPLSDDDCCPRCYESTRLRPVFTPAPRPVAMLQRDRDFAEISAWLRFHGLQMVTRKSGETYLRRKPPGEPQSGALPLSA